MLIYHQILGSRSSVKEQRTTINVDSIEFKVEPDWTRGMSSVIPRARGNDLFCSDERLTNMLHDLFPYE